MTKESVQVLIKLVAPGGQGKPMLGTIRPLLGSIRSRAGCRACDVYLDADSPDAVVLFEEWDTESAFIEHVCSRDYRYILEWMEQSVKKPEVTVGEITKPDGLEYIQRIRTQR